MKIDYTYLCDKATVREGLLHTLGAGLQVLYRDRLPAPMAVDLVVMLTGAQTEMSREHDLDITIKSRDGKMSLGSVQAKWSAEAETADPALPALVPIVVPLTAVGLPAHGLYVVNVRLDSKAARRIDFLVAPTQQLLDALGRQQPARRSR